MRLLIIALPAMVLFTGCKHGRMISFHNGTTDTAFITWKIKDDSVAYNDLNISNTDSMTYVLAPDSKGRTLTLTVGDGMWTSVQLSKFLDDFEYIEIKSSRQNLKISDHNEMINYMMARRKNFGKSKIVIRL